jgi:hypothetical protein
MPTAASRSRVRAPCELALKRERVIDHVAPVAEFGELTLARRKRLGRFSEFLSVW